jgi:hypothetical protein
MLTRVFALLALISLLPLFAAGQKKEVAVEYDRFKDVTTISAPLHKLKPDLYISFAVLHNGKEKVSNPIFSLEIIVTHRKSADAFAHKEARTVYFIIDGEKRLSVEVYKYLPEVETRLVSETARVHFTEAEFNQLTSSKTLEAQWGSTEFEFSKELLSDFSKVKQLYEARK